MSRISTLDELKGRVKTLFDGSDLAFSDMGLHQTGFLVPGSLKSVYSVMLKQTDPLLWSDGDGVNFYYENEEQNFCILLRKAGKMVLVLCSVKSLLHEYMQQFLPNS